MMSSPIGKRAVVVGAGMGGLTIPDFIHPETRGTRPENLDVMLKFGQGLTRLVARDPAVHKLTAEVQNLLKPRSVYRDPELVQRILSLVGER